MTVQPQAGAQKSQVQFMFSAGYDPAPYSISGVQLCAFCPIYSIYRKKLIKVEVLMDTGIPLEDLTASCPGDSPQALTEVFWADGWQSVHPSDDTTGLNFFTDFELVVTQDLLAQKKSSLNVKLVDHNVTETTTMKLNRIATH